MANPETPESTAIIEAFQDCARRNSSSAVAADKGLLFAELYRIENMIGEGLVGRLVTVKELLNGTEKDGDRLHPIERFIVSGSSDSSAFPHPVEPALLRRHRGNKHRYISAGASFSPFKHRAKLTGKVMDVDAPRNSLVVRPKGLDGFFRESRYWVAMVSSEGEPLVDLSIIGSKPAEAR